MPKAFPEEFRRDVIAVARKGEAPLRQIAKEFELRDGGRPDLEVSCGAVEGDVADLPCRSKVTDVGNLDGLGEQAKDFSNNSAFEHPVISGVERPAALCRATEARVHGSVDIRTRAIR